LSTVHETYSHQTPSYNLECSPASSRPRAIRGLRAWAALHPPPAPAALPVPRCTTGWPHSTWPIVRAAASDGRSAQPRSIAAPRAARCLAARSGARRKVTFERAEMEAALHRSIVRIFRHFRDATRGLFANIGRSCSQYFRCLRLAHIMIQTQVAAPSIVPGKFNLSKPGPTCACAGLPLLI